MTCPEEPSLEETTEESTVKTLKDPPDLGWVLDSGCTTHVANDVINCKKCRVALQGEHTTKVVNVKGDVGGLTNVLLNPDTPANLASVTGLLADGPWKSLLFTETDVTGERWNGCRDLVAKLGAHGLYTCAPIVTNKKFENFATAFIVGSVNDTHEPIHRDNLVLRLGIPSSQLLDKMIKYKTIGNLRLDKKYQKRYKTFGQESRMRGSQKAPRYVLTKKNRPKPALEVLKFLDELWGDSKKLRHRGSNGENWAFIIVDRATKTFYVILHKDFKSLPTLVMKKLIEILAYARKTLKMKDPKIGEFHLDGHPTQVGRKTNDIAPLQDALINILKVHVPKKPPGDHKRMGLVERAHQTLDALAITTFHECGRGVPEEFYGDALVHAAKQHDVWIQSNRLDGKSAFELRTGKKPLRKDIPYPTLFSTATIKHFDMTGGKQGFDDIGIVTNTGTNGKAPGQLMRVWIPKKNESYWRTGVKINERFSSFGTDRIERMRSGGVVHRLTDVSTRVHTRRLVHEASKVVLTTLPLPGRDGKFYNHATRHGTPILKPCLCVDPGCPRSVPGCGFNKPAGVKTHLTRKANKLIKEEKIRLDKIEEAKQKKIDIRKAKDAVRKHEIARKKKWHSPRRERAMQNKCTALDNCGRTLEEYMDEQEKALVMAADVQKPWLAKKRAAQRAKLRKVSQLEAMQKELDCPPEMPKQMKDYVTSNIESKFINMYKNIPYEKDRSPNLDVDNDFTTVRCMLGMEGAAEDAVGLVSYKRDPCEMGTPTADGYTKFKALFNRHGKRRKRPKLPLIEENEEKLTPMNSGELAGNPYYKEWMQAQQEEIDNLNDYKVFKFVQLDKSFKRITLRWIYKIKFKDGKFERFKARLVARGFTQRPGLDYNPSGISAPVARASTVKVTLAEGVKKKHDFFQFDVKSAYLLAELTDDVYAALPYGMTKEPGKNSLKLMKNLYGLKQAGFNWNRKFTKVLESLGFKRSEVDPCLYKYEKGTDLIKIVLWVDDGLVSTNNNNLWLELEKKIHAKTPLGSKLGSKLGWFLGMQITWDRTKGILKISQKSKIEALLAMYGMSECYGRSLPMPDGEKLSADGPTTPEERRIVAKLAAKSSCGRIVSYEDMIRFCREVIGSIGYLACWSRPDVRQAVYYLARYQGNPSLKHYQLIKHLMRYLRETADLTLTFGNRHFDGDCPLTCMVDSNYIGDGDSCYSNTGYVFYYHGCPILCESKKQTAVSTGTTEAELIAASHAVRTGLYLRRLLVADFGLSPDAIVTLGEDNQGCIHISRGGGSQSRLRHLRVADAYVYQEVKVNGTHSIRYVRSADNVSDIFTKPADKKTFQRLRWYLMGDAPNDESETMKRDIHMKYHWLSEVDGETPAEECWRVVA